MENSHSKARISAVIFDLDGTLLNTGMIVTIFLDFFAFGPKNLMVCGNCVFSEEVTKNILKDFLAKYGKVQDNEKEKKRLGMTFKESAIAIVNDYDLPLTPEQFSQEIMPMYHGM